MSCLTCSKATNSDGPPCPSSPAHPLSGLAVPPQPRSSRSLLLKALHLLPQSLPHNFFTKLNVSPLPLPILLSQMIAGGPLQLPQLILLAFPLKSPVANAPAFSPQSRSQRMMITMSLLMSRITSFSVLKPSKNILKQPSLLPYNSEPTRLKARPRWRQRLWLKPMPAPALGLCLPLSLACCLVSNFPLTLSPSSARIFYFLSLYGFTVSTQNSASAWSLFYCFCTVFIYPVYARSICQPLHGPWHILLEPISTWFAACLSWHRRLQTFTYFNFLPSSISLPYPLLSLPLLISALLLF